MGGVLHHLYQILDLALSASVVHAYKDQEASGPHGSLHLKDTFSMNSNAYNTVHFF